MKSTTMIAALIGITFAAGASSSAFAQSTVPGANTKPKVATPTPPPPRGPDKFTTQTKPPGMPGDSARPDPKPVDDISSLPQKPKKSLVFKCKESWCMDLVIKFCDDNGGVLTSEGGAVVCTFEGPVVMGSFAGPTKPPAPPRSGPANLTGGPKKPVESGLDITCDGDWCMKSIVTACDKNKGGLSTNDDGSVTCSL